MHHGQVNAGAVDAQPADEVGVFLVECPVPGQNFVCGCGRDCCCLGRGVGACVGVLGVGQGVPRRGQRLHGHMGGIQIVDRDRFFFRQRMPDRQNDLVFILRQRDCVKIVCRGKSQKAAVYKLSLPNGAVYRLTYPPQKAVSQKCQKQLQNNNLLPKIHCRRCIKTPPAIFLFC